MAGVEASSSTARSDPGERSARAVSVEIDLSAITSNASAIKKLIGPGCELMAVVKANGYGLGAAQVAEAAIQGGASRLGVACVDEGVQLRRAAFECPILVMAYARPEEAEASVQNQLALAIHRAEMAAALEAAARKAGVSTGGVPVHIKVDTGMGRYGCLPEEFPALARFVLQCPHLRLEGLMTNFADADADDLSYAREQLVRFEAVRRQADADGIKFEVVHAANSAATLALPEARYDMVRVGIMLSGHYPSAALKGKVTLRPAVTYKTQLARVFRVEAGESVGYGRTWVAQRPSVIGLLPVGYADGYVRAFSNRGVVLVHGRRCPVAGRISMDQTGVNVTDVPNANEGDEVVLIGRQGSEEITADELAQWAGTISYEILCGLTARVPKRYTREGQVVAACDLFGCAP